MKLIGTIRDITDRKVVEEALKHSETKFRTLFENLAEGLALQELVHNEAGQVASPHRPQIPAGHDPGVACLLLLGRTVSK